MLQLHAYLCNSILLLLLTIVPSCLSDYFKLPYFDCGVVSSHYELGYCIGDNTKDLIRQRWHASVHFQQLYQWITNNTNGSMIFNSFLVNNSNKFPLYFDEIHGISDASEFEFNKILMMSLDDELSYFAPNITNNTGPDADTYDAYDDNNNNNVYKSRAVACSDYMLNINSTYAFVCHNEDNIPETRNITFVVKAQINNDIKFYSYGYAGEILTQAMGWNKFIAFSGNFVHPSTFIVGGLGRNFIARQLLTVTSVEEALNIVSSNGQSGGHNYQIFEWSKQNGKIINTTNAEVAYHGLHKYTFISPEIDNNNVDSKNSNWTFHANRYIHLNISQSYNGDYVSSAHREARANELGPPNTVNDMLNNLGDMQDKEYPIYKTGTNDYTLHTVEFNLYHCNINIYADNPTKRNQILQFTKNDICT